MWMTEYISEIQRQFIDVYKLPKQPNGLPRPVPDGEYPMLINNELDFVKITNNKISCCNEKLSTPFLECPECGEMSFIISGQPHIGFCAKESIYLTVKWNKERFEELKAEFVK